MRKSFQFYIPLKKDLSGDDFLEGVASTTSIDKDGERMSQKALNDMVRDIMTIGVNLFGNHEHQWENTLGYIKGAEVQGNKLFVKLALDDPTTNPKIPMLMNKLKKGIKLGLSVGGDITEEKYEYDKALGKQVKIIDSVKLYEISVVGIPSNNDTMLAIMPQIMKSLSLNSNRCNICLASIQKSVCDLCLNNN